MPYSSVSESGLGILLDRVDQLLREARKGNLPHGQIRVSHSSSSSSSSSVPLDKQVNERLEALQTILSEARAILGRFDRGGSPNALQLGLCVKNGLNILSAVEKLYSPSSKAFIVLVDYLEVFFEKYNKKQSELSERLLSARTGLIQTLTQKNKKSPIYKAVMNHPDGPEQLEAINRIIKDAIGRCEFEFQFDDRFILTTIAESFQREMLPISIDHPILYQFFVEALLILRDLPEDLRLLLSFFDPRSLNMSLPVPRMSVKVAQMPDEGDYNYKVTIADDDANAIDINLEQYFNTYKKEGLDYLLAMLQKTQCFQSDLAATDSSFDYKQEYEVVKGAFEREYESFQDRIASRKMDPTTQLGSLIALRQAFHEQYYALGHMVEAYQLDSNVIFGEHHIRRDFAVADIANRQAMREELDALKHSFGEFKTHLDHTISSATREWHQFHNGVVEAAANAIKACQIRTDVRSMSCDQLVYASEGHIEWLEQQLEQLASEKAFINASFQRMDDIEQGARKEASCSEVLSDQQALIDDIYQPLFALVSVQRTELQRFAAELDLRQQHFKSSLQKATAAKAAAELLASMNIDELQQTVDTFARDSQAISRDIEVKTTRLGVLAADASACEVDKQRVTEAMSKARIAIDSRQREIGSVLERARERLRTWVIIPEVLNTSHALATMGSTVASRLYIHGIEQDNSKVDLTPSIDSLHKKMLKKSGNNALENKAFVLSCIDKLGAIQDVLNQSSGKIPFKKLEAIALGVFERRSSDSSARDLFGRFASVFGLNTKDRGFIALFRLLGYEKSDELQKKWLLLKQQQGRKVYQQSSLLKLNALVQHRLDVLKSLPDQEALEENKAALSEFKDQIIAHVEPLHELEQHMIALEPEQAALEARASMITSERHLIEGEIAQLQVDKHQLDARLPVLNEIIAIYTANARLLSDIQTVVAPSADVFQELNSRQQDLLRQCSAIHSAEFTGLIEQITTLLASSQQQLSHAINSYYQGLIQHAEGTMTAIEQRCHAIEEQLASITDDATLIALVTTGIAALSDTINLQHDIAAMNPDLQAIQADLDVLPPIGIHTGALTERMDTLQQRGEDVLTRLNAALMRQLNTRLTANGQALDLVPLSENNASSAQIAGIRENLNAYIAEKDRLKAALAPMEFEGKDAVNIAIGSCEQIILSQQARLEIKHTISDGITQRQTVRQEWADTVRTRLMAYQTWRNDHFHVKDLFSSKDKVHRERFITGLLNLLPDYQHSGDSSAIRTHFKGYYKAFPGNHLRPLLSRVLRELDTHTLPGQYAAVPEVLVVDIEARNQHIEERKQTHQADNSPFHRLYQRLDDLDRYKNRLEGTDRATVESLVRQLKGKLDDYLSGSYDEHPNPEKAFRKEFSHCLHSEDDNLANRRHSILFFGKTTRLKKVDEIHQLLKSTTP